MSADRGRVFIIGIDGATFDLIEPWVLQGKLPHFGNLMNTGTWGNLISTIHPSTPLAWTSLFTGVNPGKHGIFDFSGRVPGSYNQRLINSRARKVPALWSMLQHYGKTTGVFNVPLTFPPDPVNGFMVTGMHTPRLEKGVFPESLIEELHQAVPEYAIDVMSYWYNSYDTFLKQVFRMHRNHLKAALYLLDRFNPDCFIAVFVITDRLQHALWRQMEHPLEKGSRCGWKYRNAVYTAYSQADAALGAFLERMNDQDTIFVVSDHGFGSLDRDVYLNRFLIDEGYMQFDVRKVILSADRRYPLTHDSSEPAPWFMRFPLPASIRARCICSHIKKGNMATYLRSWDTINWKRTKAFSQGLFGNIYINVKGREPQGIIEPGNEYSELREEIIEKLLKLTDPMDGANLVSDVFRSEDVYHGSFQSHAPDILVMMRDYAYMTRGGSEFLSRELVSLPKLNHSGNHRMNGIFLARGPHIRKGAELERIEIIDILPTVLYEMGLPIPEHVDGKQLFTLFRTSPPQQQAMTPNTAALTTSAQPERPYSPDEEQELMTRLKAIGYFSE